MARTAVWAIATLYIALLLCRAATNKPYVDEAYYSLPGWNLTVNGSFGTPVIDTSASSILMRNLELQGLHQHTYWLMPMTPLLDAGWTSIVGFSLLKLRLLTIIAGLVLLACWYRIVVSLTEGNRTVAWIAVALIAIDETFIHAATLNRPDIFAALFGQGSVAIYLTFRKKSLARALLLGNTCLALAVVTHPNSVMTCFPLFAAVVLMLDRKAIKIPLLALSVVPYLCVAGAYGLYISQAPGSFEHQFLSQTAERLSGLQHPWRSLKGETLRYFGAALETRLGFLRTLRFVVYFGAFFLVALTFKRRAPACRALLVMAAISVGCLAVFENLRWPPYLIYTVPCLAALTAVTYYNVKESIPRWTAAAIAALLAVVSLGDTARLAVRDRRENLYGNTVAFIEKSAPPQALVMGSSEFYFGLGTKRLIDDIWLGFYNHIRPGVIILGPPEDGRTVPGLPNLNPAINSYMNTLLGQEFHVAYANRLYKVYLPVSAEKERGDATYRGVTNLSDRPHQKVAAP